MKKNKYNILRNKVVSKEYNGLLAQMFRDIVVSHDLIEQIDQLVIDRMQEVNRGIPREKRRTRGPLDATILSESLTFKALMDLVVNVLKIDGFKMDVTTSLNTVEIKNTVEPKIKRRLSIKEIKEGQK